MLCLCKGLISSIRGEPCKEACKTAATSKAGGRQMLRASDADCRRGTEGVVTLWMSNAAKLFLTDEALLAEQGLPRASCASADSYKGAQDVADVVREPDLMRTVAKAFMMLATFCASNASLLMPCEGQRSLQPKHRWCLHFLTLSATSLTPSMQETNTFSASQMYTYANGWHTW